MARIEQDMRQKAAEYIFTDDFEKHFDKSIDIRNSEKLKEIISLIGWPSVSKVGGEASKYAWLIAQHAGHDIPFQKECLDQMYECAEGDVSLKNIAYLFDRINTNEGKPQRYGTQLIKYSSDDKFNLCPVEDPESLNERRLSMGLNTIEEHLKEINNLKK